MRISVLLCNYNDARYLPESLGAICQQTVLPAEVIVVDDGSTDDSVAVIETFAAQYSFVRLVRNERNQGLLPSIRRALEEASGDYVVWAAADDRLLPAFLERNMATLARYQGAGVCFSRLATFDDATYAVREYLGDAATGPAFDLGMEPNFLSVPALRARLARSYLWMSGNTVLARRDALLEAGGFRPALRWHADWFAYYVVALRHGACLVPEMLAQMRERPATFSRSGMSSTRTQFRVLRALADVLADPAFRDVALVVRERPCLLSPFGRLMLAALAASPRSWPLAWRYLHWALNHYATTRGGRAARAIRLSARVVDVLTPPAWRA
jgi:glycosyltransferase involved in cell wall biosynthesis